MSFKKNTAITGFTLGLTSSTDGSDITTGTPVGYYTLDGGTQTAINDVTPVHKGSGQWSFDLLAAEMNGDIVGLTFTHASAITVHFTIKTDTKITSELNDIAATDIVSSGAITTSSGAVASVSGSVGSVTGSVGSVTAAVTTDTASRDASKADVSGLATSTDISNLNDFDPSTDAVATVTTLTNLPSIPANWLTATGIAASALDGKGDWNIGKTGYTLSQSFPANFSDFAITATTGKVTAENVTLAAATHTGAVIPTVSTLTGHTAQTADHTAALTTINGVVDDILLDTAEIGAGGSGLTDLGGMSTGMRAEVNTEADTALSDYDGPTNAEFEARTPTAAQLAYIVSNSATGMAVTFTTGGSTTTAVLNQVDGAAASGTDDQYTSRLLVFTDGTLKGVVTDITDYDGPSTTATITAIPFAPEATHNARLI